jgi:hypothetical protein
MTSSLRTPACHGTTGRAAPYFLPDNHTAPAAGQFCALKRSPRGMSGCQRQIWIEHADCWLQELDCQDHYVCCLPGVSW